MIFLEFPILGDMRFPLLIIEWISVIIEFEISLVFLIRYIKQKKNLKKSTRSWIFRSIFWFFINVFILYFGGLLFF